MKHVGAYAVAQLDVNWSYPKFLTYEPRDPGGAELVAKPLCQRLRVRRRRVRGPADHRAGFLLSDPKDALTRALGPRSASLYSPVLPLLAVTVIVALWFRIRALWQVRREEVRARRRSADPGRRSTTADFVPTQPFYCSASTSRDRRGRADRRADRRVPAVRLAAGDPVDHPRRRLHRRGARLLERWSRRCATTASRSPRSPSDTSGRRAWLAMMLVHLDRAHLRDRRVHRRHRAHVRRRRPRSSRRRRSASTPAARWRSASCMYLALARGHGRRPERWKPPLWLVDADLRAGDARRGVARHAAIHRCSCSTRTTWAIADPGLLLRRVADAGVGAAAAARLPRRLRPLPRALRSASIGIFFGGFEIQQPAFKTCDSAGADRARCSRSCSSPSRAARAPASTGSSVRGRRRSRSRRRAHCQPVGYGAMLLEGVRGA